jgi:CHASE2 domain-containing sensor protein/serine/threonine protein kinase
VTSGELEQTSKPTTSVSVDNERGETPATLPQKISRIGSRLVRLGRSVVGHPALIASLTVTGLMVFDRQISPLIFGRQIVSLEPLELNAFDHMMQVRPALPPDPRLLMVEVTEADIQTYGFPLKDALIDQLLAKIEQYQPAVIGLDVYRDIPQPPGNAELLARLQKSDRIVPVCKISDAEDPGTPPPPSVPVERVGFSDFSIDANSFVRRALLFLAPPPGSRCTSQFSLSFQIVQRYLAQKGIKPELTPKQEYLKLGNVIFKPLLPDDGGYQHADNGGYQILLNYRPGDKLARSVKLTDVLNDRFDPSLVKGRIVFIGVTAPSLKDNFYTPYSTGKRLIERTPGVEIHAQIVSQLLSAVLDGQPQFGYWPEWGEILWLWGWALTGGILMRVTRRPWLLVVTQGGVISLLLGTSVFLFLNSVWVPVVAPTVGLITASVGVLVYNTYEAEQAKRKAEEEKRKAEEERRYIEIKAREQESNLALLQELLRQKLPPPSIGSSIPSRVDSDDLLTGTTDLATDDETEDDETAIATPADFSSPTKDLVKHLESSSNFLAGHYKINRVLGSGGFGLTYLAEDMHLPGTPKCVVKHLKPARRDEKFLQVARRLFETEAEILQKLGKHPQIPQLFAYFEQKEEFYLVQEYVEGHPLNEELPVDKKLPEATVIDLLKEVLKILVFIHEHKVIHRDIKPSNIMRREADNQIVLIDFGAVKQIQPHEGTDQENYTVAIGTRGYAPAEQYAGHPTLASDIYALGMIGVQALTGIPPHQLSHSESGDIIWQNLVTVREDFGRVLEKMVRYHFAARYQSAAEALEDLEKVEV